MSFQLVYKETSRINLSSFVLYKRPCLVLKWMDGTKRCKHQWHLKRNEIKKYCSFYPGYCWHSLTYLYILNFNTGVFGGYKKTKSKKLPYTVTHQPRVKKRNPKNMWNNYFWMNNQTYVLQNLWHLFQNIPHVIQCKKC